MLPTEENLGKRVSHAIVGFQLFSFLCLEKTDLMSKIHLLKMNWKPFHLPSSAFLFLFFPDTDIVNPGIPYAALGVSCVMFYTRKNRKKNDVKTWQVKVSTCKLISVVFEMNV